MFHHFDSCLVIFPSLGEIFPGLCSRSPASRASAAMAAAGAVAKGARAAEKPRKAVEPGETDVFWVTETWQLWPSTYINVSKWKLLWSIHVVLSLLITGKRPSLWESWDVEELGFLNMIILHQEWSSIYSISFHHDARIRRQICLIPTKWNIQQNKRYKYRSLMDIFTGTSPAISEMLFCSTKTWETLPQRSRASKRAMARMTTELTCDQHWDLQQNWKWVGFIGFK